MDQDPLPNTGRRAGDEILELERSLYRAMVKRDFKALQNLLSEDLVYVHSPGFVESKAEYLAGIANGVYEYDRVESKDVKIRMCGEAAVVTGQVEMSVSPAGEPKTPLQLLFTLVWVKQASRWQLLVRQATRIPAK
ncbi:MAG: hypothetical protein A3G80_09630 [Betaproteobacteria bacterium RIFCSPLOWO2_12_FULL_62_13b]|nr:MAG: hypothetical protein A3G80_09630 [Betaproteobacteria bacterium RIFCSPLOWO2_12_FULL_62_13b]